jgi:hypothetical protein
MYGIHIVFDLSMNNKKGPPLLPQQFYIIIQKKKEEEEVIITSSFLFIIKKEVELQLLQHYQYIIIYFNKFPCLFKCTKCDYFALPFQLV